MKNFSLLIILLLISCRISNKKGLPDSESLQNLTGKWIVVNANILPFEHISFCERLDKNSIFEFDKFRDINVYKDYNTKTNCNKSQSFWIDSTKINIFEYDFYFQYQILNLTSDSLRIRSDNIPSYFFGGQMINSIDSLI